METQKPNLIDKFKALPKNQKIFIVIGIVILLGILSQTDKKHSSSSPSSSDRYESQSATCDYCGKSFLKSSGVQLSGHSEVFCSSTCATNWAWQHNIGVNQ